MPSGLAPTRPAVVSCCGSGPTGHRWRRFQIELPKDDIENNFCSKVLAHVRQRRACRDAEAAFYAVASPGPEALALASASASASAPPSPRPSEGPRFLSDACLPRVYAQRWRQVARKTPLPSKAQTFSQAEEKPAQQQAAAHPVVEASRSLAVSMEEGEVEQVPPRTWLVLEEPLGDGQRQGDRQLSATAGGGLVQRAGVPALRPVPGGRLSAAAAEANFQRAAKGASLVALRHATLALGLFGQQEMPPKQPGFIPMASLQGSPRFTNEELLARAHRVAGMVACQAAAASQRQAAASRPPSCAASAPEAAEKRQSALPMSEIVPGKSTLQKGFNALADFHDFTTRRFGNPVRTWFMIDIEENMKLGQKQFERRCMEIGFRGNVSALWRYIDSDCSGTIGLTEFQPKAAEILAGFKMIMKERFNDSLSDMFRHLDEKRRGRMGKPEFISAVQKAGYKGPPGKLFDYLDRKSLGSVSDKDLSFMQKWQPPPYIFCSPDHTGLKDLRRRFLETYGSPLKVWRKCFDRNGSMNMSWEEFFVAAAELVKKTNSQEWSEQELAAIWRALDDDCSGTISLREWDPPAHAALAEFKTWSDRVHGSVVKAFRELDNCSGNAKLSEAEIMRAARGGCKADLELVFEGLDVHSAWALTEGDVKFLDTWDVAWETWLENAKKKEPTQDGKQHASTGK